MNEKWSGERYTQATVSTASPSSTKLVSKNKTTETQKECLQSFRQSFTSFVLSLRHQFALGLCFSLRPVVRFSVQSVFAIQLTLLINSITVGTWPTISGPPYQTPTYNMRPRPTISDPNVPYQTPIISVGFDCFYVSYLTV